MKRVCELEKSVGRLRSESGEPCPTCGCSRHRSILSILEGIDPTVRPLWYGIMYANQPADILALNDALGAVERDARAVVAGLTEEQGTWRAASGSWSVAQCLDHLAMANRIYLDAMQPAADRALARGSLRRGPASPGLLGRWFVRTLEPPVRPLFRGKAPQRIRPRTFPALGDAIEQFVASQDDVRMFLRLHAQIDLAGVRFPNPFVRGLRFSLATGLHVIAAHERRHLWQAWRARRAAERAAAAA